MNPPCLIKYTIITFIVISIIFGWKYKNKKKQRLKYIKNYNFPSKIKDSILKEYPHLNDNNLNTIIDGLRTYFIIAVNANNSTIAMPSKVVDLAWHEFLLHTKDYLEFSKKAFGKFFHHIPSNSSSLNKSLDKSYKKAWVLSCQNEYITPDYPEKLPLLFRIDEELNIINGNIYPLNGKLGKDYSNGVYSSSGCGGGCGGGC